MVDVPKILVLCINYFNEGETTAFVRDVLAQKGHFHQHVTVIDNSIPRTGNSALKVFDCENVSILEPDKNLGYFGAAAFGLQRYVTEQGLPDWVIVSNTDVDLIQADLLSKLTSFYSSASVGVIAPSIFSGITKENLNPFMTIRPSRPRMQLYQFLFRYYPIASGYHIVAFVKSRLRRWVKSVFRELRAVKSNLSDEICSQPIYSPHGSFMIFGRRYFAQGGNLNYGAFLCGEELYVAETARKYNIPIIYDSRLQIVHKEHATLKRYTSRHLLTHLREATNYIARTYFLESDA